MKSPKIANVIRVDPLGILNVCTNFQCNPSSCWDLKPADCYSLDTVAENTACFKQRLSDTMWATRYGENMHKWVTRAVRDMRDNTNLHDYMDRWVIYLHSGLTAILDEWHLILYSLTVARIIPCNWCMTVWRCKIQGKMFIGGLVVRATTFIQSLTRGNFAIQETLYFEGNICQVRLLSGLFKQAHCTLSRLLCRALLPHLARPEATLENTYDNLTHIALSFFASLRFTCGQAIFLK